MLPDRTRIGGRYRIESKLAEGGVGVVYQAVDERSGEVLALKRLRTSNSSRVLALFEREYCTLAGITHPHIIRAYDYGVDDGGPYYTMELASGRDLHELAPLPFVDACRQLRDVATCLVLLHTRRLLHRDVTPRNVRMLANGECKLIDFGALTSFGQPEEIVGTPPCTAPEALKRVPLDQRADVFSFGALLYWTLTRTHAYPAKHFDDLPLAWRTPPAPPSFHAPTVPKQLDALVLRLLSLDPMMRPATMADVVQRLTDVAQLPAEDAATQRTLAESHLAQADFVGRRAELAVVHDAVAAVAAGRGSATLLTGQHGVGRTRFLRECVLQAQLEGVRCVQVETDSQREPNRTAVALVQELLELSPAARAEAATHASSLAQVDRDLAHRLGVPAAQPRAVISGDFRPRIQEALLGVVAAASRDERLLLVVDDIDEADDGSLALLASVARLTAHAPIALLLSAPDGVQTQDSLSWHAISDKCKPVVLAPLSASETSAWARALFGDVPNCARFAEWLHERTGGLPLYGMELVRRLHVGGEIRFVDGLWVLPAERPAAIERAASAGADDLTRLLAERLDDLSEPALALAQALAVERGALSRERCAAHADHETDKPFALLDELSRLDVLEDTLHGYRFTHGMLRSAVLARTNGSRKRELHLRCARWELARADREESMFARIEAGWHLLQAGEESRGAEVLGSVAFDTMGVNFAFADLHSTAPALEAALAVYTKQGRHLYERLPLMACLAQASYYEDRVWAERYGEEALAAVARVSGLALARKLAPVFGNVIGLALALSVAAARFTLTRKRERRYRFIDVIVQTLGVVSTLTASATIALDFEKAQRFASVLEPFRHMPKRWTPAGIAQFCHALKEICRENQAYALETWSALITSFNLTDYYRYPRFPRRGRPLFLGGLWFASGAFESFRDRGGALVAADALDALGFRLYRMIASALRALHYANRAQFEQARLHREQVDMHAIQIGSAWQVELWEPAALILVYTTIGDAIEVGRLHDRLAALAVRHPSLATYARLAELAARLARYEHTGAVDSKVYAQQAVDFMETTEPRSFIGWSAVWGYIARFHNSTGDHVLAKNCCQRVLTQMTPADRPFVSLFLTVELEHAVAQAGLGDVVGAHKQIDDLMHLHHESDNPLTRGRLHEAYARVAASAGDWPSFRHHLAETRAWYRSTGSSTLIEVAERLRALDPMRSDPPRGPGASTLRPGGRKAR